MGTKKFIVIIIMILMCINGVSSFIQEKNQMKINMTSDWYNDHCSTMDDGHDYRYINTKDCLNQQRRDEWHIGLMFYISSLYNLLLCFPIILFVLFSFCFEGKKAR